MENNEKQAPETKKCLSGDWKTFLIALLTSVIVVALYHFGMGFFAICSGTYDYTRNPDEYVIVPVCALQDAHGPQEGHHGKMMKKHHPGRKHFEGKHGPGPRPEPAENSPAPGK